jgi:hypothetical protein
MGVAKAEVPVAEIASGDRGGVGIRRNDGRSVGSERDGMCVQAIEVARWVDRAGADYSGRCVRDPCRLIIEVECILVGLAYAKNREEADGRIGDV